MDENAPRPKRLSLSEILTMALTRKVSDRSSVSLGRTASGETTIDVRVAVAEGTEAENIGDASALAQDLYAHLLEQYPASAGRDPASVSLSRNAKGETQIEVSIRSGDGTAGSVAELLELAQTSYDEARRKYPMADGRTAKPGSVS